MGSSNENDYDRDRDDGSFKKKNEEEDGWYHTDKPTPQQQSEDGGYHTDVRSGARYPNLVSVMCYIFSPERRIVTVSQVKLAVSQAARPVSKL